MLNKEVISYLQENKISQLYKKFENCFSEIDKISDIFLCGDLLNELELAHILDKSTGVYAKLVSVVNALESYMERILNNEESKFYQAQEKIRTQDTSHAKSLARTKVSDIRDYVADFKSYLLASQQNIVSAQSRLKRLVVVKGAKNISYHGEVPVEETVTSDDLIEDSENQNNEEKAWDFQ